MPQYQTTNFTTDNAASYKGKIDADFAVLARIGSAYQAYAQASPNMTVSIATGALFPAGSTAPVENAVQTTGTITAPVTNPRIDRLVIDQFTGVLSVVTGTEAASPVAPAVPAGKLPVARINLATTTTQITNSLITDERTYGTGGGGLRATATRSVTGTTTLTATDFGKAINANSGSAFTITLPTIPTGDNGSLICIYNKGAGAVTVSKNAVGETIDAFGVSGQNSISLPQGAFIILATNSTTWVEVAGFNGTFVNRQVFNSSGTWTKPPFGTIAIIEGWGGGGSGAYDGASAAIGGGGGGAAYEQVILSLSALGATESVTIASGGASKTVSISGDNGGTSTVGSVFKAYGGGGGSASANGGGGGGALGSGGTGNNAGAAGGAGSNSDATTRYGGAGGGNYISVGRNALFGGASGGGGSNSGSTTNAGGTSVYGGNGGNGGNIPGVAGSQPGGGGGASVNGGSSGAGGAGRVIITVI